jgi:sugar phosphate isomerase/epimerase
MELAECSLNSITARSAGIDELISLATSHGFGGLGVWRDVLADIELSAAARRIAEAGLRVTSVCRGGMFVQPDGQARRAALDDNLAAVDQAHTLAADCLVLVCGAAHHGDLAGARAQTRDGIAELAPYARLAGVRLAVEPFHPMMAASRSVITSLTEANDLIADLNDDTVGIAMDAYHLWWDVALPEQTARAASRIFSVQLADWITPIHGELSSRGMPGEGCIDMTEFVNRCRHAGYQGLVEVEVLSDHWWSQGAQLAVEAATAGLAAL